MTLELRREQERQRVRKALVDAGRALFVARPFDEVTLRTISKKAGYSAPTILNHFGSKEGLIYAICEEDFGTLRARFERIARERDPVERLRKIGLAYVEFAMENPNHYRFMFMTLHPVADPASSTIDRTNPDQDAYAFLRATVTEAISSGKLRDGCDDPDMIAQVLWSGVHGLVSLHLTKQNDPYIALRPVKAAARLLTEAFLRGLAKGEE